MSLQRHLARRLFALNPALSRLFESKAGGRIYHVLVRTGIWRALKRLGSRVRGSLAAAESYEDKLARENAHFSACQHETSIADNWLGVPRVLQRLNHALGATASLSDPHYFLRHFSGRYGPIRGLGLDLGCGPGEWPRRLIDAGLGERYEAIDVAEGWIAAARADARNQGYPIEFRVEDANLVDLRAAAYDVIFLHHALHHIFHMDHVVGQVARALRPGGMLLLFDYVGPSQMRWNDDQLRVANGLLQILPRSYRMLRNGTAKESLTVTDPTFLSPFEAIRSADIMPALGRQKDLRMEEGFWLGSLLPLILSGIATAFREDDPFACGYIDLVWDTEQLLHRTGKQPGDFFLGAYRKLAT